MSFAFPICDFGFPKKKDETSDERDARLEEMRQQREYKKSYRVKILEKEREFAELLDKCVICSKHHCCDKCHIGVTHLVNRSIPWNDPSIEDGNDGAMRTLTIRYNKNGGYSCTHGSSIQCAYKGERTMRHHIPRMVNSMITYHHVRRDPDGSVFQDVHRKWKQISKGIHEQSDEAKQRLIDICVNITNRAIDDLKVSLEKVIRGGSDGLGSPSFLRNAVIEELGEFPKPDRRVGPRLFGMGQ